MSGAFTEGTAGAEDDRPECSPASALYDLIDLLHRAGLVFEPAPNQLHVAAIAMADVLRALGIRPSAAPRRTEP